MQVAPGRLLHHPYMQGPSQQWGQSSQEYEERFDFEQTPQLSPPEVRQGKRGKTPSGVLQASKNIEILFFL